MIYLAAFDETLFLTITSYNIQDRVIVTIGTTIAAAVPMFFAVGMIKESVLTGRETIYYYETLLKGKVFWILSICLLISVATLIYIQGNAYSMYGGIIMSGCVLLSIYIIKYVKNM